EHEKENALRKLERKHMDAIVLNSLRDEGAGFGTDTNCVTVFRADGSSLSLPLQSKSVIADGIIDSVI
ncbi:MAG: phosphopantothenoylcysteine decarboxylase, partial [Paludibacteraceae bacterium]|nr:phosphopantothenoylcysteine decarboxylase [Paludibacteraceae bacterium]